jgi:hypothetical protein
LAYAGDPAIWECAVTKLRRLFTDHPATVGETYAQHFVSAVGFSAQMMIGAICCLVHAVLPFLFQTTGSGKIQCLYSAMVTNRGRVSDGGRVEVADPQTNEPQRA